MFELNQFPKATNHKKRREIKNKVNQIKKNINIELYDTKMSRKWTRHDLEYDVNNLYDSFIFKQSLNPLTPIGSILGGVFRYGMFYELMASTCLSLLWIVHLLLYTIPTILTEKPVSTVLNTMLLSLSKNVPFVATFIVYSRIGLNDE